MSMTTNAREQFYAILKEKQGKESKEIDTVDIQHEDSAFYELCQKYADIGLNLHNNLSNLQYDTKKAVDATREYIEKNNIKDIDIFLSIIKYMHKFAYDEDDNRLKKIDYEFSREKITSFRSGKFNIFPEWITDDFFDKIEDAVRTGGMLTI